MTEWQDISSDASDFSVALHLANMAHGDQVDKAGEPYILHPMRVALKGRTNAERIVGILHDVVEDSAVTVEQIREQWGDEIASAVDCLTKREGETYTGFIIRCGQNDLARVVKMRDLEDNMDLSRLPGPPTNEDAQRHRKYVEACGVLAAVHRLACEPPTHPNTES